MCPVAVARRGDGISEATGAAGAIPLTGIVVTKRIVSGRVTSLVSSLAARSSYHVSKLSKLLRRVSLQ